MGIKKTKARQARQAQKTAGRVLNRDGSGNVVLRGLSRVMRRLSYRDFYHSLIGMSWPRFLGLTVVGYLVLNAAFALAYTACGEGALDGVVGGSMLDRYPQSFFFSVQTLATIGYGKITPVGFASNSLVTLEALTGLMCVALATGLMFARFSRPTARVVFSRVALISAVDGQPCLMFRMSNERRNQILEMHASVVLIRTETTKEGERYYNLYDLKLERELTPVFSLTWTALHPIDRESPLYGMTLEDLIRDEVEIIVSLVGTDATVSQTIHARTTYQPEDLRWDRQFVDILLPQPDGRMIVDLERIHDLKELKEKPVRA